MSVLARVVHLYDCELHSKHLLVHAVDALLRGASAAPTSSASLLPSTSSLHAPAVPPAHLSALELYTTSWALDAELDADLLAATQHMWNTQVADK